MCAKSLLRSAYLLMVLSVVGDHEVHVTGCSYMPDASNRIYLYAVVLFAHTPTFSLCGMANWKVDQGQQKGRHQNRCRP
jgi:hypothetical protein